MTRYPEDHWIRSRDAPAALGRYLDQQRTAYGRLKNRFVRELIGDVRGKRVLDYGCGGGCFVVDAAEAGAAAVVGVDAEDAVLGTAGLFAELRGVAGRCRFVRSDGLAGAVRDECFDVILLKDVLEHVDDDLGLLRDAAAHLRRGGALVVSTQNSLSLNYLTQGLYHRVLLGDGSWYGWDETHLRFYTFVGLARKLRLAGLHPLRWRSTYLVPHRFTRRTASGKRIHRVEALACCEPLLGRVPPLDRLGWNLLVKAGPVAEVPRACR